MPLPPTAEMGRLHEEHAAKVFGGSKTRGSGSQWDDQMDGANAHDEPLAFRWDCKSTKAASITITLAMIAKAIEQAQGERPAIPLRWYASERLTEVAADWVALRDADLSEILEEGRQARALRRDLDGARIAMEAMERELGALWDSLEVTRRELGRVREALENANAEVRIRSARIARLQEPLHISPGDGAPPEYPVPGYIPRLPWTVVNAVHVGVMVVHGGLKYGADGRQEVFKVDSRGVRVERSPANRPRLVVNDVRVPDGDLYVDGILRVRACASDQSIEVG